MHPLKIIIRLAKGAKRHADTHGWVQTLLAVLAATSFYKIDLTELGTVRRYKRKISNKLGRQLSYTVKYGPFRGMKLNSSPGWGTGELGAQCLGIYEPQVIELLERLQVRHKRSTLIDIGGADGYYAIGGLVNDLFDFCIVFELSSKMRHQLRKTAIENGVSDRLEIRSAATFEEISSLLDAHPEGCIVLCDIEGAEYDLFGQLDFTQYPNTDFILEIHEFNAKMSQDFEALLDKVSDKLEVSLLRSKIIAPPAISEIERMGDIERALLLAEGRSRLGKWLHIKSINKAPSEQW